jgi:glycine/D-amino acid oxidase-like deaminating enzyme
VKSAAPWQIVGQGLAGTCLAWSLWRRNVPFTIRDREQGGSSRVAAGMVNPVTGKNFEPSWRICDFLPEALTFYQAVDNLLGVKVWHAFPVLRLARDEKEWRKIESKLAAESVTPWIAGRVDAPDGWHAAVEVKGGGRLDTRAFLDGSRGFFQNAGVYQKSLVQDMAADDHTIHCDGALGLMCGDYGSHRCAKGEMLTVRAPSWDQSRIRIGGGGWLVPMGDGCFKAGATYEWDTLDEIPTAGGRAKVVSILEALGGAADYEIITHEAGIRPILRRSQPLIGPMPQGGWMFNGLGSKGSLYAPGMARRLADWLLDGIEPECELDFRHFSA